MKTLSKFFSTALLAVTGLLATSGAHSAPGVVFIIGSDVISFHGDSNFINPVVDQIANFGTKRLLFLTNAVGSTNYTNGNVAIDFKPYGFVTGATSLAAYSGVYADSPSGCCNDPGPAMDPTAAPVLGSFLAGGGSVAVGDFQGIPFWDSILGFTALPGVSTVGPTCVDPGVSTASGLAFGFAPSYTEGCFVHQTYDPAFWMGKGYFALQTTPGVRVAGVDQWVTMATGFVDPGAVPEPATLLLVGAGIIGASVARRRKA